MHNRKSFTFDWIADYNQNNIFIYHNFLKDYCRVILEELTKLDFLFFFFFFFFTYSRGESSDRQITKLNQTNQHQSSTDYGRSSPLPTHLW